jgi:hypothetical protein
MVSTKKRQLTAIGLLKKKEELIAWQQRDEELAGQTTLNGCMGTAQSTTTDHQHRKESYR